MRQVPYNNMVSDEGVVVATGLQVINDLINQNVKGKCTAYIRVSRI